MSGSNDDKALHHELHDALENEVLETCQDFRSNIEDKCILESIVSVAVTMAFASDTPLEALILYLVREYKERQIYLASITIPPTITKNDN